MKKLLGFLHLGLCASIPCLAVSCGSLAPRVEVRQKTESQVMQIPVLVVPGNQSVVPRGSRIVIAEIEGPCTAELKDALMRRLIDNKNYSVLTRDNLKQIVGETDLAWAGRFNTDTAARLGKLMGASLWIVGRVAYCGPSFAQPAVDDNNAKGGKKNEETPIFSILAGLQIIDLETGKVLVSSSNEGSYIPRAKAKLDLLSLRGKGEEMARELRPQDGPAPSSAVAPAAVAQLASSRFGDGLLPGGLGQLADVFGGTPDQHPGSNGPPVAEQTIEKLETNYVALKAAEDLANGFADKFFARPTWEDVEMWSNTEWMYGEANRLVQLGHCSAAVAHFEKLASRQLLRMDDETTSEYLHNYGVSLLCANQVEAGVGKLRAAYRIRKNPSTLKMLGLAGKLVEWSLQVAPEKEPEVIRFLRMD